LLLWIAESPLQPFQGKRGKGIGNGPLDALDPFSQTALELRQEFPAVVISPPRSQRGGKDGAGGSSMFN
jgi:hypothetical protein